MQTRGIKSLVISAIAIFLALAAGCHGRPVVMTGSGNVGVDLAPTPRKSPVIPMATSQRLLANNECLVAVIDVDGILTNAEATGMGSWGENPVALFRERLDAVAKDGRIQAIVVRINTPGGSVTASDIMWRDLIRFKQKTKLPVVACLMDVGAGGGYYLATAADQIVAHPTSVTGAIGCSLNLYNLQDLLAQFNIASVPILAGKNVDLGSPLKPLDDERRHMLQAMADEFHQRFRNLVVQSRPEVENLDTTFDGRVFTAKQALELKLVDDLGYLDDAVATARQMANVPRADVVFFHRPGDPALSPYAITPNKPLQNTLVPVSIPGMDRSRLPAFLYMWQIDPAAETIGGK